MGSASPSRTLLLPILLLTTILFTTAGLSIGLTYVPCYASLCSETYVPYETRLHIAIFYALLASTALLLFLLPRARLAPFLSIYLTQRPLPLLRKRISIGGLLLSTWITGLTLATTPFWLEALEEYWARRTEPLEWTVAKIELTVTGVIGHHADYFLGLLVLPVGRNSLLAKVFGTHAGTLLWAHKLLAYLLLLLVIAHAVPYYAFVIAYHDVSGARKEAFQIDNPTLTLAESEATSYYYWATLGSGVFALFLIVVIVFTSLRRVRRASYNTFYYAHIICGSLIFIAACIHASTDFYFLLPGLVLLIVDWVWRILKGEAGGLRKKSEAMIEDVGHGWFRVNLPVSARYIAGSSSSKSGIEADAEKLQGSLDLEKASFPVSAFHPLQTYYIIFPTISNIQNHAFTVSSVGTATTGPVLLFQRAQSKKKQKKLDKEWTWKLAAAVTDSSTDNTTTSSAIQRADSDDTVATSDIPTSKAPDTPSITLPIRIEGPYIPTAHGFDTARHCICIVGGTGITGALSIAGWWLRTYNNSSSLPSAVEPGSSNLPTFTLVWTVRHAEMADSLPEWKELQTRAAGVKGVKLIVRVTSVEGRIEPLEVVKEAVGVEGDAWVYASGPEGLLDGAEQACVDLKSEWRKGKSTRELDWYVAKWEV